MQHVSRHPNPTAGGSLRPKRRQKLHTGKLFRAWLILMAMLAFVSPDRSKADGTQGIAFVEAPEQGGGVCLSDNADRGFQCARAQCMESGALASDCFRVKWCYPAGWSADIFKQHQGGHHWHHVLCGWDSEADLDAAIDIACKGSAAEYLIECMTVAKWSPDGTKTEY